MCAILVKSWAPVSEKNTVCILNLYKKANRLLKFLLHLSLYMSTLVYEQRLVEEEITGSNSLPLHLALICFFSLVFPIHTLPFLQAQQADLSLSLRGLTLCPRHEGCSSNSTLLLPPGELCMFPERRNFLYLSF